MDSGTSAGDCQNAAFPLDALFVSSCISRGIVFVAVDGSAEPTQLPKIQPVPESTAMRVFYRNPAFARMQTCTRAQYIGFPNPIVNSFSPWKRFCAADRLIIVRIGLATKTQKDPTGSAG